MIHNPINTIQIGIQYGRFTCGSYFGTKGTFGPVTIASLVAGGVGIVAVVSRVFVMLNSWCSQSYIQILTGVVGTGEVLTPAVMKKSPNARMLALSATKHVQTYFQKARFIRRTQDSAGTAGTNCESWVKCTTHK